MTITMEEKQEIGRNFCSCRGTDSLSAVSDDCGLSPYTVGAIEVGSHGISCKSAILLAKRYGKTMTDLVGWSPRKKFSLEPVHVPIEELNIDNFAPKLDLICRERGISSRLLAERTKIARGTINHYRIGRRCPSLTGALKIARALNVSCDDLLLPLTEEERKRYEKYKNVETGENSELETAETAEVSASCAEEEGDDG